MKKKVVTPCLVNRTEVQVRFSEVDSMHVVWHGEYVRYFEDGREAFGRQYGGLGYMDIYRTGFTAPVIDLQVQFRHPLKCDDVAVVETRYINTGAAKICFEYEIRRRSDGQVVAAGSTVQVFLNSGGELELTNPDFYIEWKKRWNIG